MLIMSVKLNKKVLKTVILLIAAIIIVAAFFFTLHDAREGTPGEVANASQTFEKNGGGKNTKVKNLKSRVSTNEDRVAFIKLLGLKSAKEPSEVMEVAIPSEFDKLYSDYNEMQKKNGFDLEKYRGKNVKRWNYELVDYPENEDGTVRINLLIYREKVIGGDVCSVKLDGFMRGLKGQW